MDERRRVFSSIKDVLASSAEISGDVASRLNEVAALFGLDKTGGSKIRSIGKAS
jgi:hypothetical protein